jgi:hypothetical protein
MPDASRTLSVLDRAADYLRRTPGRTGGLVRLDRLDDVLVVGDLHGNIPAFRGALNRADLRSNPRRHLILQELIHGEAEYPDNGGDRSHQLVDAVAALICQFPGRVHLIIGNHELSELTGRPIAKAGGRLNDLFRLGIHTAYAGEARRVLESYHALFRALPVAVRTPNRVFVCHTLPDPTQIERFDPAILDHETWSPETMARGGSLYAITWGRGADDATADRFADLVDADLFITGHEPTDSGHRVANHRQLIIDGTPPLPSACLFAANGPLLAGVVPLVG